LLIGDNGVVFDGVSLGDYDVFRKAALLAGADEAVLLAKRVISLPAVVAGMARHKRRARNRIACFEGFHPFAKLRDIPRELMPQHDRIEMRAVVKYTRHI